MFRASQAFHVCRINAIPSLTYVMNFSTAWYGANEKFIRESVCKNDAASFAASAKTAISVQQVTGPKPAFGPFTDRDLGEET